MEHTSRIAVVVGSTRPNRICGVVASWVRDALQDGSPLQYELLDLAGVGLPLLDEPLKPALQQYQHEHTRRWSRRVSALDGFLFVFPQYNWGYPAVLKNALDYLYAEWWDKPATVFTYGTRGGGKGARQLQTVLHGLHMNVLEVHAEAVITDDDVDDRWQLADPGSTLDPTRARLRDIDTAFSETLLDGQ